MTSIFLSVLFVQAVVAEECTVVALVAVEVAGYAVVIGSKEGFVEDSMASSVLLFVAGIDSSERVVVGSMASLLVFVVDLLFIGVNPSSHRIN